MLRHPGGLFRGDGRVDYPGHYRSVCTALVAALDRNSETRRRTLDLPGEWAMKLI